MKNNSNKTKLSVALILLAALIALFGAAIHLGAILGGPAWYGFFGAPPFIVESARAGTWLAPSSAAVIAGLMGLCAAYAFSALGLIRRLPFLRLGLAGIAAVCLLRVLALPLAAIRYPELLGNRFELIATLVWGLAGMGFAVAFFVSAGKPQPEPIRQR